jgi:hypothetical protein
MQTDAMVRLLDANPDYARPTIPAVEMPTLAGPLDEDGDEEEPRSKRAFLAQQSPQPTDKSHVDIAQQ